MLRILLLLLSLSGPALALTLKDGRGKEFTLEKQPERIASLTVGTDEVLLALLEGKARQRIAALSIFAADERYSNAISDARPFPKIGLELEKMVALKPDLVLLARFTRPETLKVLDNTGVKAFVLSDFSSLDDIKANILSVGKLIFAEEKARNLVTAMNQATNLPKPKKIFKVINYSEAQSLYGTETTFHSIITKAHCSNLAAEMGLKGWPKVNLETIASLKPDFVITSGDPKKKTEIVKTMQAKLGWREIPAVKAGKVVVVPPPYMLAVSHHITKAVTMIYDEIYGTRN